MHGEKSGVFGVWRFAVPRLPDTKFDYRIYCLEIHSYYPSLPSSVVPQHALRSSTAD